jgi:hypothetical protein
VKLSPQASLYEDTVENADLEQALEEREKLKQRATAARKRYAEADEVAKGLAATISLDEERTVRVGRFLLARRTTSGRTVQFETGPTSRLSIRPIPDLP